MQLLVFIALSFASRAGGQVAAAAAAFEVTETADSSENAVGSFRWALRESNVIFTPSLTAGPLPPIPNHVQIRAENVILDGSQAGSDAAGLTLLGAGSVLEGLRVQNFGGVGILVAGDNCTLQNVVVCNNGLDGIRVTGRNAVIARCHASSNGRVGIMVDDAALNATIARSWVGVDATGSVASPNGGEGVHVRGAGARIWHNVLSGNLLNGLFIDRRAGLSVVEGNVAGLDATGTYAVPNGDNGIKCLAAGGEFFDNLVGGNTLFGLVSAGVGAHMAGNTVGGIPNALDGIFSTGANAVIAGNTAAGNNRHGINSVGAHAVVCGNVVGGGGTGNAGIGLLIQGTAATVTNNTVAGNLVMGIHLAGDHALCCHNNVTGNGGPGVVESGFNMTICGSIVAEHQGVGVWLQGHAAGVSGNVIGANRGGGVLVQGDQCRLEFNTVSGNIGAGLTLQTLHGGPVFMRANRVFGNTGPGYLETVVAARVPVPLLLSVIQGTAACRVWVPPRQQILTIDVFGNSALTSFDSEMVVDRRVFAVPEILVAGGGVFDTNITGLTFEIAAAFAAISATFESDNATASAGSSLVSASAPLMTSTRACDLCSCSPARGLVDCTARGLPLLPAGFPAWTEQIVLRSNPRLGFNLVEASWRALWALPRLHTLDASNAGLADAQWAFFSASLEVLVLANNNLSDVAPMGALFPSLTKLDVAGNKHLGASLRGSTFADFTQLTTLSLANCNVSGALPPGLRAPLGRLFSLDLSGHALSMLSFSGTMNLSSTLQFLGAAPSATQRHAAMDVSNLLALNVLSWIGGYCPAGFTSVADNTCLRCKPGTELIPAGPDGGNLLVCRPCSAGTTDHDYDSATPCVTCGAGTFAPAFGVGSCELLACTNSTFDHDLNPDTACVFCGPGNESTPTSCQPCAQGTIDDDFWAATACFQCSGAVAGTFVPHGAVGQCTDDRFRCPAGTADDDANPSTPCLHCVNEAFVPSGSAGPCDQYACPPAFFDLDHDASTPCEPCKYTLVQGECPPAANARSSVKANQTTVITAALGAVFFAMVVITLTAVAMVKSKQRASRAHRLLSFESQVNMLVAAGYVDSRDAGAIRAIRDIPFRCLKLLDQIGEGAFSVVHQGIFDDRSGLGLPAFSVAIKSMKRNPSPAEEANFLREAAIMSQFDHRNVVSLIGACITSEPRMLVMQLCENGSLLSFLRKRTGFDRLHLKSKVCIMADVASAMAYLSGKNVVHRDLAARNVLVAADFMCKVSDFGLSREMSLSGEESAYLSTNANNVVPLRWTAPEAISSNLFTTASDIWAFGILCVEVLQDGQLPYAAMSNIEVRDYVKAGHKIACPADFPREVFDRVFLPCFEWDPAQRPNFAPLVELLQPLLASGARCSDPGFGPYRFQEVSSATARPSPDACRIESAVATSLHAIPCASSEAPCVEYEPLASAVDKPAPMLYECLLPTRKMSTLGAGRDSAFLSAPAATLRAAAQDTTAAVDSSAPVRVGTVTQYFCEV